MHLVDGLTEYEGKVEMYLNSEWTPFCADGWDQHDATVVCRQLNYLATSLQVQGIGSSYKINNIAS